MGFRYDNAVHGCLAAAQDRGARRERHHRPAPPGRRRAFHRRRRHLRPATAQAAAAFQRSHGLAADGIIGPNTWNRLINGAKKSTPAKPATTKPAPANGKLTHRQALTQLAAAGIKAPVGRTSLGGVRARTIQGVIALKKASGCTITITGGTESGHSTRGNHSHANGYKLDLRTRDEGRCVTNWIKATQRKGAPRGKDARWHGTLNGISAEYVYEIPRSGGVHWDIAFI
ncbi:peptidoglycan-binding protein [Streptomyces sp. NPDC057557]|uniref:peptidoglycan-binding domain-containing protein n=1 Tax=Streptomyces sp. NPDC057557 TaxID=3346167 RepID=UPI0036CC82F8